MLIHAKIGSVEKRVIMAVLSKTMKKSIVKSNYVKFECGDISIGHTKKQSIRDDNDLLQGNQLNCRRRSRKNHVTDSMTKQAVAFILHKDHIITTSWGDMELQLGPEETIITPRMCQKIPVKELWEQYQSSLKNAEGLGRSTSYYFTQDLTFILIKKSLHQLTTCKLCW